MQPTPPCRLAVLPAIGLVLGLAAACSGTQHKRDAAAVGRTPTPSEAGAKVEARPSDLICEMTRPTGSNIPKRVCRTRAQAEWERAHSQESMRDAQQRGSIQNTR